MRYWRGVITHLILVFAQPAYLATRYVWGDMSLESKASLYLMTHLLIWVYLVRRVSIPFFNSEARRLPSPPGEKLVSCHFQLDLRGEFPTIGIENMMNGTPNDGVIVLWSPLYLSYQIIPTQPATILDILNTHSYDWEKPSAINKILAGILGHGLVNVEGAQHKAMRRVVTPAFAGNRIRSLTGLFYSKGVILSEVMACRARCTSDGVLELTRLMSRATLDIIGSAGVGKDFNTMEKDESQLAKLYESVIQPPFLFLLINQLFPQSILPLLNRILCAQYVLAQSQLREQVGQLMREKKAQASKEGLIQNAGNQDIISSIMRSGDFSDDYLVSQMLTFLAAGHDTTASALAWATWLISVHPQVQDRLRAECQSHLANILASDVDASIFDAEKMPYLNAVCNETLRLYPPVAATSRQAMVPTAVGGVQVPKGAFAFICPWAINRSHALWGADAGEFKPERWLAGGLNAASGTNSPNSPHNALLTFLHGPRSCIGQSFARLELKCLLAALMVRLRFELVQPGQKARHAGFVTIKPVGGLRLKVYDLKEETPPHTSPASPKVFKDSK